MELPAARRVHASTQQPWTQASAAHVVALADSSALNGIGLIECHARGVPTKAQRRAKRTR
eukprot:1158273-Pelagomonas_calceolata.AAC.13